ncbi:FAD-dependent oxidoreductase [Brevundimonas sp.]|uniref:NAD(P)/FAD-dependent oxidoreductase n=1 Tax=Brevundimonas sp. TaxID=1871086 RepID=UPI00248A531F|nr:FAD-dependent oxidoreductase [Brevundimonas sp.]MDI1281798.1 FAD-dependent oxidoreductase [Brevundimonas sp.]
MSRSDPHVLILGAGHAGGTAAALLRQYGFEGPITLVGEEPIAPYHRPPLSKAWLRNGPGAVSLPLKPAEFYAGHGIDFRPGVRAEKLARRAKTVTLSTGEILTYNFLIIATGARPVKLPVAGSNLAGVLELRTVADAERLRAVIRYGQRLAVIGGGYIGLEVAASARALGAEVVVIEREARLLARVAGPELSTFFLDYHRKRGVSFELGATVTGFEGRDGHVTGVKLDDGRTIACDAALVGIGATPNDEIAREAGLDTAGGVIVDLEARTADPAIFAIGDVARRPMPIYDRMFRMESVPNAIEQAKQAAGAIVGRAPPPGEAPWQWSDQYDLKLQIAGYAFDVDRVLLRGDPDTARFAVFHLKGDRLQSVEAVNSPQEFVIGRQLIASRKAVDVEKLADPATTMKELTA